MKLPRKKNDLNTIYISERLQEKLRPISRCALTTVVAPMGYGKTTAVNWYLNERVKKDHEKVIRISIYTNNLPIFWKSAQNAFVSRLTDGVTYRFHHMMKECAERAFGAMDKEKQTIYLDRYGKWYEEHRQYLHALDSYRKSGNFHEALGVIQKDAGILLASLKADDVLSFLSKCPEDVLEAHPLAILVLMRSMFNWRKIPEMLKLKDFLIQAIDRHTEISMEERGNLLGECDLITSFLMYNDISKMSHFHRSASRQMSRPAISIRNDGGWTFGSPSVLMMFHREPGGTFKRTGRNE